MLIKDFLYKLHNLVKARFAYPIARICSVGKPLRRNKYFCISMSGNSYGDNVRYLSDEIKRQNPEAEVVWAFTPDFIHNSGCDLPSVILYSLEYYKQMLTSKFILSNARLNRRMFHKRDGQIYIQTWHGTALKRIGLDARKPRPWWKKLLWPPMLEFDVNHTDAMISGSGFMTEIYRKKFGFEGEMWEVGTPRNDVFFAEHPEITAKVHRYFNIPPETQIILYAPTFRTDGSFEYYDIDAQRLLNSWQKKTGHQCVFLARLHPNLARREGDLKGLFPAGTIYASSYPDMQELLYATDLLVTDYSSSMFDYMYSLKPVLMYVRDWEVYDRGFYFKKEELPFMVVENNEEIAVAIAGFDFQMYHNNVDEFLRRICSFESGRASYLICQNLQEM